MSRDRRADAGAVQRPRRNRKPGVRLGAFARGRGVCFFDPAPAKRLGLREPVMRLLDTWLDRIGLGQRFARLPHHDFTTLVIRHRPDQERYYPEVSRLARESGAARLLLAVAPDGVPYRVRLLESSGYLRLDEAAHRLALDFRFASPASPGVATARGRWQTTLRVTFVDPQSNISPATT